jgi:hypothetical protein
LKYETVVINGWAFCRASEGTFPELYECSVEPEYVLSARLLTPHRPFSRPDRFGVAQLHKSVRYPGESHWSEQPDWDDNPADYQSDLVLITSVT